MTSEDTREVFTPAATLIAENVERHSNLRILLEIIKWFIWKPEILVALCAINILRQSMQ
jgi:hypothetical protein